MGWALVNMMYDKFPGLPPKGSPLGSLFFLVLLERKQNELLSTRAMVQAMLVSADDKDPAIEAYHAYFDQTFPFLERAKNKEHEEGRAALLEFAKHPARLDMRPIWKAQVDIAKAKARSSEQYKRFSMNQRLKKYGPGGVKPEEEDTHG